MIIQTDLKKLSHRTQIGEWLNARGLIGKGVEIGTLFGAHATDILKTWKGHLYCIDPWRNQDSSIYFDGANSHDMNQVYAQVCNGIGRHPRCTLFRTMSLNAVGKFEDGELSFAYMDGNHSIDSVRNDLASWWAKVQIGGLFCGHDFFTRYDHETNSDALTAVCELSEAIDVRVHCTWDSSWYFIKTEEADRRFRDACIPDKESKYSLGFTRPMLPRPVYSDNSGSECVVVIPVAKFDFHLAKKMLAWWKQLLGGMGNPFTTVALCSTELTTEHMDELGDTGLPNLCLVRAEGVKELGYFGTPNQMFKAGLEWCENNAPGKSMLWVESDCVPIRANWVDEIMDEYRACGRPFMADFIRSGDIPHTTGNAVYPPNWRELAPSLDTLGTEACGWDSLCAHDVMPRCHPSDTIQQVWRPPLPITGQWAKDNIQPETALFHQCKDGSLIDVLCEKAGLPLIPLSPALCESTYEKDKARLGKAAVGPQGSVHEGKNYFSPIFFPSAAVTKGPPLNTEIMIVTCARDLDFLKYCLASIEKNAKGFTGTTLVVPRQEEAVFKKSPAFVKVRYYDEIEDKGMLHHEVQICRGDEWCPNAEAILHVDADCMFWKPCTPADYAPNGKPMIVRERYSALAARNPNRMVWQRCVQRAIGIVPVFETMCRHPNIHLRDTYALTRSLVEKHTGKPFDEYVLESNNTFPQSFAEFPLLGAVAIEHFSDRYTMVDYDHARDGQECGIPNGTPYQYLYRRERDKLVEVWSHGGIAAYKSHLEAWIAGRIPAYQIK